MWKFNDITGIKAEAWMRARYWMPPFEYYPGATPSGIPHTDESEPDIEERMALARIRELPPGVIEEALTFRGLLRGPRGFWRAPPPAIVQAVRKFQSALNYEPTGMLTAPQAVRLIRMNAVDGDAISQTRLGIMYAKGIGVKRNFPRAEKWFTAAYNQRYGEATVDLGELYKVGPPGVAQDKDRAARLFEEAKHAGPARFELRDQLANAGDNDRNRDGAER
jgi:hypothetical protein